MLRYVVTLANKEEVRYSDLLGTMFFHVEPFSLKPVVISLDPRPARRAGIYWFFVPKSHIRTACQRIKEHFGAFGEIVTYPD